MSDHSELDALIKASIAIFKAMTPEQRAAVMEAQRQSWVRGEQDLRRPTESASPPRVPGASAQDELVGVESGPGQPIDICERLEASASEWDDQQDEDAILSREAAAEIRRLRAEVEPLRDPAMLHANLLRGFPATLTQEQRLHLVGSAKIDEIRADGFRAGIEAAARWHDEKADFCARNFGDGDIGAKMIGEEHREYAGAIRALADKPAPDSAAKGG